MLTTGEGKWVLFDLATGEQRDFWPIDARKLVAAGTHSAEPPKGVVPVAPLMPPERVGMPAKPSATVAVAEPEPVAEPVAVPAAEAEEEPAKPRRRKRGS
jgi:hypothetical protein